MSLRKNTVGYVAILVLLAMGCCTNPATESQESKAPSTGAGEGTVTPVSAGEENAYRVEGPHRFEGTIGYNEAAQVWDFSGSFTFMTGGYGVGEVDVNVMKIRPEKVTITVPVYKPRRGQAVTQALTHIDVSASILASPEARFTVRFEESERPAQ